MDSVHALDTPTQFGVAIARVFLRFALALLLVSCAFGCVTSPIAPLIGVVAPISKCRTVAAANGSVTDSIIGGVPVDLTDPDQHLVVQLKMKKPSGESVCTGTLISDWTIVTAAHCVYGVGPGDVLISMQTNDGCPMQEQRTLEVWPDKIVVHPDFDGSPQSFSDVALIRLSEKAPSDQVRLKFIGDTDPTDDELTLLGFGITDEMAKDSQTLRRVIKSYAGDLQYKDKIIVMDQTGQKGGFCRGDSGAPILGEVWREKRILGINSATVGMKQNSECHTISIAMNASYFVDWIDGAQADLERRSWYTFLVPRWMR